MDIRIGRDIDEISQVAAAEITRRAEDAVRRTGRFTILLAGGSTPRSLYRRLASPEDGEAPLPWGQIHVFFGDERHVPPDHADSNYRMADETLLSQVPIPVGNVHRITAENPDAREAAKDYERTIRRFFCLSPTELPRFDLVLLGMGPDGHTASLFPGTPALDERERLVVGQWVDKLKTWRITLAPAVLNNATAVVFLVVGEDKAETLGAVLRGPYEPSRFPAQMIRPTDGELLWLVDRAASRLLAGS